MRRRCEQCGAFVSTRDREFFLFLRPGDVEVWVCGAECLAAYNADSPRASYTAALFEEVQDDAD